MIFLETVARLSSRASLEKAKKDFLWRPHIYEMPFTWPFLQEHIWVETSSVFIKDKLIIRELSKNKQGNIINLRTYWAGVIVEEFGKWNHGHEPPLCLIFEIGIVGAAWLNYTTYSIEDSQRDWRTNIPYWLGIPGDCLGENKLIKRLDDFGWVWEPYPINEVTVTTKYDEVNIDVSLWYIGCKGEHTENSRDLLGNLLFCWWIRNLTL